MENGTNPSRKRKKLMPLLKCQGSSNYHRQSFSGGKVDVEDGSCAKEDKGFSEQIDSWPDRLSEAQLNLLVCIKELAMERLTSVGEIGLEEILPASALQTIGIIMEELAKDWVRKKASAHKDVEFMS